MLTFLSTLCLLGSTLQASAEAPAPVVIALEDAVETWTAQGHRYRERKQLREAQAAYGRAAQLDGNSLATRVWVLRTQLEQGSINDALDVIDGLAAEHAGSIEIDYLYGMAFSLKARGYLADGVTDSSVGMNFGDALTFLERATTAQPYRFRDGSFELARAAWYSLDNELARSAIDRYLDLGAGSAEALILKGRIAMSQFATTNADPERAPEADAHWLAAEQSFLGALALLGAEGPDAWTALGTVPGEGADSAQLIEAADQLARVYIWREDRKLEAARAWEYALALHPNVDFGLLQSSLTPELLEATLTRANARFEGSAGAADVRNATLLWYLGKARYDLSQWDESETAFQAAVAKWPDYSNAWYYIARSRYERRDFKGSVKALRKHWELSPEDVVATITREDDLAIMDFLAGKASVWSGEDAALLSEICAEVAQTEPRYWNNLGLFLRDTQEYERAYAAYARALELSPEDPNILNDTALILHYHLERDLDAALDMYQRAHDIADLALSDPELDEETRDLYTVARRDARNNRRLLLKKLGREDEVEVEVELEDAAPSEAAPADAAQEASEPVGVSPQ